MTTSLYQSDVKVEIAFNAGFTTPEGSRVWTDVSEWVELAAGINIGYGRSDERSQADANTLSLTLDNSDGRFTPGRAASPYFPNVRLYRPIRVTVTPPSSGSFVRFVGFINQWPVEWNGSDSYAMANLTAASRMSRLSLSPARRSLLQETVLAAGPKAYYPLSEPDGSVSASDISGTGKPPLRIAGTGTEIEFGSAPGPTTDGLSCPMFNGGQYLSTPYIGPGAAIASIEFWFTVAAPTAFDQRLIKNRDIGADAPVPSLGPDFYILTDGRLGILHGGVDGPITPDSVADGLLHHVVGSFDGTTDRFYLDGLLVDSGPAQAGLHMAGRLDVGGSRSNVSTLVGSVSDVAIYDYALSSTLVNVNYLAGTSGYNGEGSNLRFRRYAEYVKIPNAELVTTSLRYNNVSAPTEGQGVIDLMRQIETTESAVLYDRRDGRLALIAESVRYAATPAFTLDMAAQHVEADFSPQLDPSTIVNDITVTRLGGGLARMVNTASRDENGESTSSIEVTSNDDDHLLNLASWTIARYAEPKARVPSITVDINAQVGKSPDPSPILLADIHTMIRVTNQPSQAGASTADYFVEGYSESIGVESYFISFNVSPADPFAKVFILDDPVRGVLDGSYVLGL